MSLKPYQDNVIVVFEPEPTETASGLAVVHGRRNYTRSARAARVYASGPGYWTEPSYHHPQGVFIPNEAKPGDRVLVSAVAGQDYSLDLSCPRHNKPSEFEDICGVKGEFRIIREQEILAVIGDDVDIGTVQMVA